MGFLLAFPISEAGRVERGNQLMTKWVLPYVRGEARWMLRVLIAFHFILFIYGHTNIIRHKKPLLLFPPLAKCSLVLCFSFRVVNRHHHHPHQSIIWHHYSSSYFWPHHCAVCLRETMILHTSSYQMGFNTCKKWWHVIIKVIYNFPTFPTFFFTIVEQKFHW